MVKILVRNFLSRLLRVLSSFYASVNNINFCRVDFKTREKNYRVFLLVSIFEHVYQIIFHFDICRLSVFGICKKGTSNRYLPSPHPLSLVCCGRKTACSCHQT
jgi:hypothetical protein